MYINNKMSNKTISLMEIGEKLGYKYERTRYIEGLPYLQGSSQENMGRSFFENMGSEPIVEMFGLNDVNGVKLFSSEHYRLRAKA